MIISLKDDNENLNKSMKAIRKPGSSIIANCPAVGIILFDHLEGRFLTELSSVQFKKVCLPLKNRRPLAENIIL